MSTQALAEQSPAQIDTELARIWNEQLKARQAAAGAIDSMRWAAGQRQAGYGRGRDWNGTRDEALAFCTEHAEATYELDGKTHTYRTDAGKVLDRYNQARAALEALAAEAAPLQAEYARRRWSRFFLVDNAGGHVHSSMECSTCYPTTEFNWLPEYSGGTEESMVAAFGEMACTVCFPSAPTMTGYGDGTSRLARYSEAEKAERAAEKAAKAEAKAAKMLVEPVRLPDGHRIETVAAAKTAIRDAIRYSEWYQVTPERQATVWVAADALLRKGTTPDEIDTLVSRAVKAARAA